MDVLQSKLKGTRRQLTLRLLALSQALDASENLVVLSRTALLEETVSALAKLDQDMLVLLEEDDDDDDDDKAMAESQKAFEYQDKASLCLHRAKAYLQTHTPASSPETFHPNPQVKLEKLVLPVFDGNMLSFQAFWDTFESRVNANPNLNPVDKFDYLLSRCKGRAADALAAIPRTSAGYELAIKTLKRRFGRKAPIINLRITELIEMKRLSDDCTTSDLRKMLDTMNVHIRSLLSLGLDPTGGAEWIGPVLLARLPLRLRLQWERLSSESGDDEEDHCVSDLGEFLDFFHRSVETEEASIASAGPKVNPLKSIITARTALNKRAPRYEYSHTSSLNTHVTLSCCVCKASDHCSVSKCPVFLNSSLADKKTIIKNMTLCFNCLSPDHRASHCASIYRCRKCGGKHHTLIHTDSQVSSGSSKAVPLHMTTSNATLSHPSSEPNNNKVLLQSCNARAQGPQGGTSVVRVLYDSCSTYSFIQKSAAEQLRLREVRKMPLIVNTFGCNVIKRDFPVVTLKLSSLRGAPAHTVDLIVTEDLVHPIQGQKVDIARYPHLKSLFLPEDYHSGTPLNVDIVLGANYYHDFVLHQIKKGSRNEPVAVKTVLGWTLHGPFSDTRSIPNAPASSTSLFCELRRDESQLDSLSHDLQKLWNLESVPISLEEEPDWVKPKITDGRISTGLPWKFSERPLSNRPVVVTRQRKTDSRLTPDQKLQRQTYFQDLEKLNIIEPCPNDIPLHSWYLPHHCVWQKKLRVVFDGSFGQPSINNLLMTGPNLLTVIPVCLTSFRLFDIPVTADIEKAFLQISIEQSDRDFLRFIHEGTDFRFCRLPFGLTCSPSVLNSGLKLLYDSFETEYPDSIHRLRHCTYVDDVVTSFPDEKSLLQFKSESMELFRLAGMNLRGWTSSPSKILGLTYHNETDEITLPLNRHDLESVKATRREVLSYTSSLFDPLGLWLPWTIRLRSLLQASWKAKLDWDDCFPPDLDESWQHLKREASQERELRHPRCLQYESEGNSELHAFCDASQKAYATCIYLVSPSYSRLVYARSRVTPLKPLLTIPRAELMAALLASRSVVMLTSNIPDLKKLPVFFWSDSTCVLGWLRGAPSRLQPFVRNRVTEISQTDGVWSYVPSGENPADVASRGISARALNSSDLWFHGPSWIHTRCDWPSQPSIVGDPEVSVVVSHCTEEPCEATVCDILPRVSTLCRFVRILSWILRFVRLLRKSRTTSTDPFLTYKEQQLALYSAIQHVQEEHYPAECQLARDGASLPRSSPLFPLKPQWDHERSVLVTSPRTNETPKIFLPPSSRLTLLIIVEIHASLAHAGVDRTLVRFQRTYWTSRSRQVIKRILRDCRTCKKFNPPAYAQSEGKLPDFRSKFSSPFEHVGMDHAGPFYLKDRGKVYVLLFTCACTRAVHLELVSTLNTLDTALAFRRFQSRRSRPLAVYSDNAPCFKRLAPLVPAQWNFIPERSPSWGGWWERLIQVVKRSLKKTIGRTFLTFTELHTVLIEIEGAINERPLTYVSDEVESVSPLTPAHFLHIHQPLGAPWTADTQVTLGRRWRYVCKVAEDLKSRWRLEYLPTLRRWRGLFTSGSHPKVGDVVLVSEGPKGSWPLARVMSLHPGRDGIVRMVTILLRGRLTRRLTRMLFPLECSS